MFFSTVRKKDLFKNGKGTGRFQNAIRKDTDIYFNPKTHRNAMHNLYLAVAICMK